MNGVDELESVEEYCELRSAVGCARIFWDKGYIAYLADVMVKPEYQKQGIGKMLVNECIQYINKQLKTG